jgi:MFS transporter, DHA2 family, multidrug resistance protein
MTSSPVEAQPISAARKWAITLSVMVVAFMQVLDTSVTNVVLPHLQGSLSAGLEEVSWVITSYLAANAIIIPATGWLAGLLGRKRFFLVCCVLFTVSSVLSGMAPNLTFLILARIVQGIGGGPIIPLSQAILWEIFPLGQRGLAMAVWGVGFMMGPIIGPTLGGYIADNWSWRWIFYINLPVGLLGFFMASACLFDPPYLKKPSRVDWPGLILMILGFGCLQLMLDRGEREDWFDSRLIVTLAVVAGVSLVGFLIRELIADHPIMDLRVFTDRNFAFGASFIALIGLGMFSSMVLLALYSQKLLGYDAYTSGLVLAPGGIGNMFSLILCGRLITRVDQRLLLTFGCLVNAISLYMMSNLTLGMDYWTLTFPRVIQGFALGFIFVPLSTLTLATIRKDKLVNATSAYNVLRNLGGSVGIALATTFLAQRSQFHQHNLVAHVTVWDPETQRRLAEWTRHFLAHGADAFTAQRQATAMLYQDVVGQAQVLAYADDFWVLAILFSLVPLFLPLMRRVHADPAAPKAGDDRDGERVSPLPAPVE